MTAPRYTNDLFVRAALGERTPRTPVWLMRQAGRTDPAYNKLKEEAGLPLHDLFCHPELAARISLLPKRLGVDAIIFFQDILTPLGPMGAPFRFVPGPAVERPVRTAADADALQLYDVEEELPFVPETLRLIQAELDGEMPVLGFAGAPLTLLVFLAEGKSFGDKADNALAFLHGEPAAAHRLLDKLTEMTIDYLRMQIGAGVAAVQLFESAAHLLSPRMYALVALPYQRRIFDALRGLAPTILFAREKDDIQSLAAAHADIISLPASISIAQAREALGEETVLQGNLDNRLLAEGTLDEITAAAKDCIAQGGHRGHIFNLSHGLLRETPYENVVHLVKTVRETVL